MQDLKDILSAQVSVAEPVAILDTEFDEPELEPEAPAEEIPETIVTEEIPNSEPPKAMPHSHFAQTIVGLVDGLQSSLIPMWRKKTLFTGKELEILDTLDTTGGTAYPLNSPENRVFMKWKKHIEVAQALPFTPAETDRLVAATERYANTMQITVSPFTGLLMAFGEVAATRAVLIINE